MVVVDLDGNIVEGTLNPSSDTASHLYIYRHRPDVNGVVHTHSRYATAFAAVGRPIPVYLTAQADEFGGEIPCAGFALIGDEAIGALVVEGIGRSPAILLKNHGVFTVGPIGDRRGQGRRHGRGHRRARSGPPSRSARRTSSPTTSSSSSIVATRPSTASSRTAIEESPVLTLSANEVWFVTGSQHLYGPETLEHVAEHSAGDRRGPRRARRRSRSGSSSSRS